VGPGPTRAHRQIGERSALQFGESFALQFGESFALQCIESENYENKQTDKNGKTNKRIKTQTENNERANTQTRPPLARSAHERGWGVPLGILGRRAQDNISIHTRLRYNAYDAMPQCLRRDATMPTTRCHKTTLQGQTRTMRTMPTTRLAHLEPHIQCNTMPSAPNS
jgi:hypothetical protein